MLLEQWVIELRVTNVEANIGLQRQYRKGKLFLFVLFLKLGLVIECIYVPGYPSTLSYVYFLHSLNKPSQLKRHAMQRELPFLLGKFFYVFFPSSSACLKISIIHEVVFLRPPRASRNNNKARSFHRSVPRRGSRPAVICDRLSDVYYLMIKCGFV